MKSFLKKAGKVAIGFLILVLIGVSVALGIAFFLKNRELNDIYSQYNQATDSLNKSDKENQLTIGNLQDSYRELNQKITDLTKENTDLKAKLLQDGFGAVKGTILPFLTADSNFGQYQLVCAINTVNTNLQYCLSVSGMDTKYTLSVPAGAYIVTARIVSKDGKTTVAGYQATYTEYVQCVVQKGAAACDKTKLTKNVQVEVKAGQVVENINPTDWVTSTVTP